MRYRLRTLLMISAIVPPLLGGAWFIEWHGFTTNCGGNNATRTYVREYAITMAMFAEDSPDKEFSLDSATQEQRLQLACIKTSWGVAQNDILISTEPVQLNASGKRRVVVICSRPFTNVPRYLFHRAPPSHAVAFSDGSTELISPTEFTAIDRTMFLSASEITGAAP